MTTNSSAVKYSLAVIEEVKRVGMYPLAIKMEDGEFLVLNIYSDWQRAQRAAARLSETTNLDVWIQRPNYGN